MLPLRVISLVLIGGLVQVRSAPSAGHVVNASKTSEELSALEGLTTPQPGQSDRWSTFSAGGYLPYTQSGRVGGLEQTQRIRDPVRCIVLRWQFVIQSPRRLVRGLVPEDATMGIRKL